MKRKAIYLAIAILSGIFFQTKLVAGENIQIFEIDNQSHLAIDEQPLYVDTYNYHDFFYFTDNALNKSNRTDKIPKLSKGYLIVDVDGYIKSRQECDILTSAYCDRDAAFPFGESVANCCYFMIDFHEKDKNNTENSVSLEDVVDSFTVPVINNYGTPAYARFTTIKCTKVAPNKILIEDRL